MVGATIDVTYDDLGTRAGRCAAAPTSWPPGRDPTYPMPDGLWPGTGAILAAVETASGRTASIVGKPEPQLFFTAIDRLGEGATLVIGDRLDTDVAAAAAGAPRLRAGAHRRHERRGGRGGEEAEAGRGCARPASAGRSWLTWSCARKTHHKHSSSKGYRRLLDELAEIDGVHRVATGRVKPRMGAGPPGRADLEGAHGRLGAVDHDQHRRRDRGRLRGHRTARRRRRRDARTRLDRAVVHARAARPPPA